MVRLFLITSAGVGGNLPMCILLFVAAAPAAAAAAGLAAGCAAGTADALASTFLGLDHIPQSQAEDDHKHRYNDDIFHIISFRSTRALP